MYIAIIGILIVSIKIGEYPPIEFTICWFAFWMLQALLTMKIQQQKKEKENKFIDKMGEKVGEYVNEENVGELTKHFLGVKIKPKKGDK